MATCQDTFYSDYSQEDMSLIEAQPLANGPGGDPSFPVKLHFVLSELRKDGLEDVMSWMPHGRCFRVNDKQQFEEKVLPFYFRMHKYSSFQRQLNLYGFKRLTASGPDKGGYYNPRFLRQMPELAARILRKTVKNMGPRKAAVPSEEPNFYEMSFLPEIEAEEKCQSASPPKNHDAGYQSRAVSPEKCFTPTAASLTTFQVGIGTQFPESMQSPRFSPTTATSPNLSLQRLFQNDSETTLLRQMMQRPALSSWQSPSLARVVTPPAGALASRRKDFGILADQYFLETALRMKNF